MNPQEALNSNEMKKCMQSMLSYEHYFDLNVKIIKYEDQID